MTLLSTRSAMFAKGLSSYMVWLKHRWHDSMSKTVPNEKKGKFVKKKPQLLNALNHCHILQSFLD